MKIYVKDIMPEQPVDWVESEMLLRDAVSIMLIKKFTILPARDQTREHIGTLSQQVVIRFLQRAGPEALMRPVSSLELDECLQLVEPFTFLDEIEPHLRQHEAVLVKIGGHPNRIVTTWDFLKVLADLEVFRRLLLFENGMRGWIEAVLSQRTSSWWSLLSSELRDCARDIGEESLRGLTLDHLRQIIEGHREAFKYEIRDDGSFERLNGRLKGISKMRNELVHGRKEPESLKEKLIRDICFVEQQIPVRQHIKRA